MEEECSLQRLALAWVHSFLGYWTCLSVVVAVVMVEAVDVVLVVAEPAASSTKQNRYNTSRNVNHLN